MIIISSIAYFATIFFFGWQMARWVFSENRIEYLIAFVGIFGIGLYTFFINIAGHFIEIQTVFYLVLVLFLLLSTVSFLGRLYLSWGDQRSLEWGVSLWWRKILLFSTLFLSFSIGLISFNHLVDLAAARVATAVTMSEGNFPPVEIYNPTDPLYYHYAPDLFAAATYKVTGLPIYVTYDIERAILGGTLFLLGFLIIEMFFKGQFLVAYGSSLMMIYTGGLVFLNGLSGVRVLYHRFVLGLETYAPFKFVSDVIVGEYTTPVINSVITQHWGAMAFALMMIVIYIYFFLLHKEDKISPVPALLTGGFLLALLALVSEPYFAVLCSIIFIYPFAFFFLKKDWISTKKIFINSFVILTIAVTVAISQGGLLYPAIAKELDLLSGENAYDAILYGSRQNSIKDNPRSFTVTTPWKLYDQKPIYNRGFIAELSLLLVATVLTIVLLFRWRSELAIFLTGLLLLFFFIPLFIDSDIPDIAGQLGRLFFPLSLFGGLVIGLVLVILYSRVQKPILRGSLIFITFILMAQGLWTHSVWLLFGYPPGTWNPNAKFFTPTNALEKDAYNWIKMNTTIKDWFLILKDDYTECGVSNMQNCIFVFNSGRMAPTFVLNSIRIDSGKHILPVGKAALFEKVSKSCDSEILQELGYDYIYVDNKWPKDIEAQCIKNNKLTLQFQGNEGEKFIRIYNIDKASSH